MKWFDFKNFNVTSYELNSQKGFGDFNEIIPGFIAFSSPLAQRPAGTFGKVYTPQDYLPIFHKLGVKLIVRLNPPSYDEKIFQ